MIFLRTLFPCIVLALSVAPTLAQPVSWEPLGPFSRVPDVLVTDSAGVIYASGRSLERVYRSTDAGATWELLVSISASAITSGRQGALYVLDGRSYQVSRSMDGGRNWYPMEIRTDSGGAWIHGIYPSPDGTLYARQAWTKPNYLLVSTNDGASWTTYRLPDRTSVTVVGFNARGHVYTTWGEEFGITSLVLRRSTDRGATWQTEEAVDSFPSGITMTTDGAMYIPARGALYRSTDDGETWTRRGATPGGVLAPAADGGLLLWSGVDRQGLHRSTDGGLTWDSVAFGGLAPQRVVSVSGGLVASGTGGIFRSTDGGRTVEPTARGMRGSPTVAISAYGARIIAKPFQVPNLERRDGRWDTTSTATGYHVSGDGTVWRALNGRVGWSRDAAETWNWSDSTVPSGPVYFGARGLLAALGNGNVWLSRDTARTWEVLDTSFRQVVVAMGFDTAGTVLVSARETGMWRYDAASGRFGTVPGGTAQASAITSFVTKSTGEIFVATMDRGIRRSLDDGRTFVKVGADVLGDDILRLRTNSAGHIVAATSAGVFISRNNGDAWESHGPGSPVVVRDLAIDQDGRAWIATEDGVFASVQTTLSVDVPSVTSAPTAQVIPNPAGRAARLVIPSRGMFTGTLVIVDALGTEVYRAAVTGRGTTGSIDLPIELLANGFWRVRLTVGNDTFTAPLVVAR